MWRNEASLPVQWRTLNACSCTLCAVGAAFSASLLSEHVIRRHSDVVGDSSGRSYVTEQWHNVPLLRTRALEGMLNGKKVRDRRYQIIDNIMINGLYEDTKRKAEKRVEWRMLSLQRKTCPWAEHYDIEWHYLLSLILKILYIRGLIDDNFFEKYYLLCQSSAST